MFKRITSKLYVTNWATPNRSRIFSQEVFFTQTFRRLIELGVLSEF